MRVQLRLCRRHGGRWRGYKYNRWSDIGTRCPACEHERRALNRETRENRTIYKVQVRMPDGWRTLNQYADQEKAVRYMDRVHHDIVPLAELRVINDVNGAVRDELGSLA